MNTTDVVDKLTEHETLGWARARNSSGWPRMGPFGISIRGDVLSARGATRLLGDF